MARQSKFSAYHVQFFFALNPCPFGDFGEDLRRTNDPQDEAEIARKRCEDEVAAIVAPYFGTLERIGCINAGSQGHYLIVDGEWECPEAPLPWEHAVPTHAQLGFERERKLVTVDGPVLQISITADPIDFTQAFNTLNNLGSDYELSEWGGNRTLDRLPRRGEDQAEWAKRVGVPAEDMRTLAERLKRFGFNLGAAAAFPIGSARACADWVLRGVIPLADITTLVAPPGIGKTSFAHYLLVAAGAPERAGIRKTYLGQEVMGEFNVALFNGEETSDNEFIKRQTHAEGEWPGENFIIRPANLTRTSFASELASLAELARKLPHGRRGIIVIDSAQAFLEGDDTKAHIAAEFYQKLREFALGTGWAILLIHHTTKSLARSFATFRDSVRGSSVHVQMPRNVLGMLPRGAGLIGIGTVKCNFSPEDAWLREGEEILIQRNPETGIFELIEPKADVRSRASGGDIERVALAIGELNKAGRTVNKSGIHGLFEQRLPLLAGLSRSFVQQAVAALIENGQLEATKDGLALKSIGNEPDQTDLAEAV